MHSFQKSLAFSCIAVSTFILFALYEWITGNSLTYLGIHPRTATGLLGIIFSPVLHGGLSHLFSNSITFLLLGTSIYYFYPKATQKAFPYLYLLTSLGVWFFGRGSANGGIPVYHIGASGLIYAFAAFLFFSGVFRRDRQSLAISASVAIVYNGLLYSLFPNEPGISWEAHLSGFIVGAIAAYFLRHVDSTAPIANKDDEPEEELVGFQPLENRYVKYHFKSSDDQTD